MIKFEVITIFPNIFNGFLSESLLSKAIKKKLITIKTHFLRDWTEDRHQTVDGKPYGGGPGLVFKVEPIHKALKSIKPKKKSRVILFSPRGQKFTTELAKKYAKLDQLIFVCGRYEGIDERVAEHLADDVISIGDYVLNGGEVAAMVVMEAVSRYIPGFMHDADSAIKDDHASYTKPEVFSPKKGVHWKVPKVLLSGNHKKIQEWRSKNK
jgi:tRNA (guanine37-N1)-methyltransferase